MSVIAPSGPIVQARSAERPRVLMQWLFIFAAGCIGWGLFVLGAVLQHEFFALLFPAICCILLAVQGYSRLPSHH
ncbi:MAG: hypothetical protein ACR2GY_00260 [Phycisphaerales bacterium]